MMLKSREKGLKMKEIAAQSTASYGLAQQPTFVHAPILNTSKNAYDLFAAKMLQLSNPEIYSKCNRRNQTPIQQNVSGDDGDVGKNRCFCDYKTPCNRQKLRQNIRKCMQHRRLKQIRSSEQTISLQYRPNIDGVAATFETTLEVELGAELEIAVNGSVVQNQTTTMRSDSSAYICADADRRTTAKNEFASTLLSKEALFHTNVNATCSHGIIPSTLKIGKPITITTTLKTSFLSLVRNAFLMIALILTVLTLQRVSGQYLLSIAATTASATTTRTARDMGATTIIPVSSTTVKNMFDITETNNIQPCEHQKIRLKRQDSAQKQPKSYVVQKSNHHSDFSRVSAVKLQNAKKHNNSQIEFSKFIYNNYKKRKFFNEKQIEVRQQKIIALQQRHRSKRGTVESIVTQLKSNNTESDINSNRNSKNDRTFKSELSGNSNITTNRYNIKFTVEDSNQKTHSANDQKLLKLVMDGLGLEQLPNMKKPTKLMVLLQVHFHLTMKMPPSMRLMDP
ncbi:uncharacterized protein LOC120779654 isoform X1 [Bactrocera tryoni]|uniref:uncharacterized protein LOC120779654 isoform X1 n=1 Tax=Bactrocera tryoni TaxID=59916 RepID=UPI001A958DA7|nr:uncharacterized protein LOC120779654 isoform X1 [Bactrocera tryoni]